MFRPAATDTSAAIQLMYGLWPFVAPVFRWIVVSVIISLALPVASGALIWLAKDLVDDVIASGDFRDLPLLTAGFLVVGAVKILLDFSATRLEASIAETIVNNMRAGLYRHLIALSPGSLPGEHSVGDLLARLESDTARAEILLYTGPGMIVADSAAALFFTAVLLTISWRLSVASLLVLPPIALLARHYAPRIRRAARIARHRTSTMLSLAEEKLSAITIIHALNTVQAEADRLAAACAAMRRAEIRTVAIEAKLNLMIESAVMTGSFVITAGGAYEIWRGTISLGELIAFLIAISRLNEPVRNLAKATGRLQRGVAGAKRIAELLEIHGAVTEAPRARPLVRCQGAIEFQDVFFSYAGGSDALNGLSLAIAPGETVAIVGPSGSGKSTLIQLLLRLRDPECGYIRIDGTDIREFSLASLRGSITAVFQDPYLFRGSVAHNIRYGAVNPTHMLQAARIAHVTPFVERSPEGWAMQVGPQGGWLSGGQRQRIAFARALMRDTPILVLDEATASVDSETEELIHAAVAALPRRTVLLIGHRLSSLRRADRIVVIDNGRVVETGMPDALLRPGSRYYQLFAAQLAPTERAG
jgi:ATP-binding cassette subfamily B protein